jgi:hypothetical protein
LLASGPDISGRAVGTDEAFVSYQHDRKFAYGHGVVFNPGK